MEMAMSETLRNCTICGEPNGRHLPNCVHQKFRELPKKPRLTVVDTRRTYDKG